MFQKVLRYTGRHRKTTYASILVLVAGVAMSVLPYFFLYRLLRPLLTGGSLTLEETLFNAGAMAPALNKVSSKVRLPPVSRGRSRR